MVLKNYHIACSLSNVTKEARVLSIFGCYPNLDLHPKRDIYLVFPELSAQLEQILTGSLFHEDKSDEESYKATSTGMNLLRKRIALFPPLQPMVGEILI